MSAKVKRLGGSRRGRKRVRSPLGAGWFLAAQDPPYLDRSALSWVSHALSELQEWRGVGWGAVGQGWGEERGLCRLCPYAKTTKHLKRHYTTLSTEQVFVIYLWQMHSIFLDKSLLSFFSETIVLIGVLYVITCMLVFCSNKEEVSLGFLFSVQFTQLLVNVYIQGY